MTLLRRLAYLLRRRRAERDLADELQFHREMAEGQLRRAGVPADEASRVTSQAMGNTTLAREDVRAIWIPPVLDWLRQDVRHSVASLRRSPGLVVVSALSLGLGVGLNAVLYVCASTVYRHQPTMTEPDRMVGVEPGNANQFSYPNYEDLVRSGIFADALGFRTASLNLGEGDRVRPIAAFTVTANFFDVLGVDAQIGRTFSRVDALPEREPRLVVVTHAFWQGSLRGDPGAVGEALWLNGQRFTVVGVLPEKYRAVSGWMAPSLYVPVSTLTLPTLRERGSPSLSVLARLLPGGTEVASQAAVTAFGASLEQVYPEPNEGMGRPAGVFPADAMQFRGTPEQFFVVGALLWASVALVLVIACVNVTGLLMARAAHAQREIAIRVAIGAGRGRVVQGMLVESLLLALFGAAAGLPWVVVLARIPESVAERVPLFAMIGAMLRPADVFDSGLVFYALGMVLLCTLVCGLLPAISATRADVMSKMRQGGASVTARVSMRHALVVGQVAMSLVLVVVALLCVRSQIFVGSVNLGFDIDRGVVARFSLDPSQYPGEARLRFADRVLEDMESLPGVSSASVASLVPLGGGSVLRSFHPAGRTDIPGSRPSTHSVGPGYFQALGIPLIRGRDFSRSDVSNAPVVAIVNETFAKTHFPGQDVIGRRVQSGNEEEAEVIGLVRDSRIDTIGESPQSVIYYAFAQRPSGLIVHVRTSVPPDSMVPAIVRSIESLDRSLPVSVETLREATSLELGMRRTGTYLVGSIGVVGLLLAMIGLYGVMAYVAATRTAEVGIRMVLGASGGRIRREVLGTALTLVMAGVAIGGAIALGLAPAMQTFLVGVRSFDPFVLGTAAMLFVFVGLTAGLVPAHRSSRVDPLRALRQL